MVANPKPARRSNTQGESSRPPVAPTAPNFEDKAQASFQSSQTREKAQDVCHGCKKPGHWVRDCPDKPSAKIGIVEDETLLEGEKLKFCMRCGEVGHFNAKCPNVKRSAQAIR